MEVKKITTILFAVTLMLVSTFAGQKALYGQQVYLDTLTAGSDSISYYNPGEKYSFVYLTHQDSSVVFRDSIYIYQKVPVGTSGAPQTKNIQVGIKDVTPNDDWELIYTASGTAPRLYLIRLVAPAQLMAVRRNARYVAGKKTILVWQGKNYVN